MAWILAVDDEEGIRNLIQNALEKDGQMIISVSRLESENSGQGLRHICEEKPEKKHMQWKFQEYVLIWRERVFRWGKRKFL